MLSIAAPFGGNLWYLITLISPAAGAYYLRKGDRVEEVTTPLAFAYATIPATSQHVPSLLVGCGLPPDAGSGR